MKLQTVNNCAPLLIDDDLFMFICFQLYACWCTMSFSSCLRGLTGKPSSPNPWTPLRRWVCLTVPQRYYRLRWWGMAECADVGYGLTVPLNAAFWLIILPTGSGWICTIMSLIHMLCRLNAHTCIYFREDAGRKATFAFWFVLRWSRHAGSNHLHEIWSLDHLRIWDCNKSPISCVLCCLLSSQLFVSSVQS